MLFYVLFRLTLETRDVRPDVRPDVQAAPVSSEAEKKRGQERAGKKTSKSHTTTENPGFPARPGARKLAFLKLKTFLLVGFLREMLAFNKNSIPKWSDLQTSFSSLMSMLDIISGLLVNNKSRILNPYYG